MFLGVFSINGYNAEYVFEITNYAIDDVYDIYKK